MQVIKQRFASLEQVVDKVQRELRSCGINSHTKSEKFRFLMIEELGNYDFSWNPNVIKDIARYLDIAYESVPSKYSKWTPGFSNLLKCIKYTNPRNPKEYVLHVKSRGNLGSMELLHFTPDGFASAKVFQKIIPYFSLDLEELQNNLEQNLRTKHPGILNYNDEKKGRVTRGAFSDIIAKPVNSLPGKMDPFTLQVIHALFGIVIPEVEGVCSKCFNVSIPDIGFGIRYEKDIHRSISYEIRLSPMKLGGKEGQSAIYITNKLNVGGKYRYVKWQQFQNPVYAFDINYALKEVHIPQKHNNQSAIFDFLKSDSSLKYYQSIMSKTPNLVISLCECR